MEMFKVYINSTPAMISTAGAIVIIVFLFKFAKPISKKIAKIKSVGKHGAEWDNKKKGQLPETGLEKIKSDFQKANDILELQTQNNELLKVAQQLNKELEDTKVMLFFERVARAMVNWQYFFLKLGYESPDRQITIRDLVLKTKEVYPDLEQFVTEDVLLSTLDALQTLNFIKIVSKPYTPDTPVIFTELTVAFLVYFNTGNLSL